MSQINLKSISGITSITTPAGVDNQLTLHNNNTTEAVKLDIAGNLHFHNHLNITGISSAANFKTGTSNLHSTGLNVQDLDVDGHAEFDNINISGVSTHVGLSQFQNTINLTHASAGQNYIYFNEDLQFAKNGTGTRFKIDSSGRLLVGAYSIATPKSSGSGSIDLDNQAFTIMVGGNHPSGGRSDNTAKTFRMSMVHNTLAEEPINILQGYCDSSDNNLYIGGGTGAANSVTQVRIYTGANTTTTGGTERIRINNSGAIGLSGANYGSSGQVLTSQGSGSAVTWSTISGTTINNNADNRVITGSGTANTLEGESTLTYSGNRLYAPSISVTDNGAGSPLLSLRQDDQNPWAFIIGNDTYSSTSGLFGYVENGGDMLIRLRGNSEYKSLTIEQEDGTTNRSWLTLGNGGNVNLYYQGSKKFFTHNLGCTVESTGNTPELTFRGASNLDMGKIDVDQFATNYSAMRFFTMSNTSEIEYMRLLDNGNLCVGGMTNTSSNANMQSPGQGNGNTAVGCAVQKDGRFICNSAGSFSSFGRNQTGLVLSFTRQGGDQGGISVAVGSVSYGSGSDYRLKENVSLLTDGITRVKQLVPKRFNFIEDTTDTLRDGFLAHEVSSIVPEAITGTKDEVDSDNKPVYQQIDQAKLVPLLTAALQEAITKIETLETKVAALEGS